MSSIRDKLLAEGLSEGVAGAEAQGEGVGGSRSFVDAAKKVGGLLFGVRGRLTRATHRRKAIRICRDLLEEGAQLAIHDPKVEPAQMARDLNQEAAEAADALSGTGSWALARSVEEAVAGADAVLILTEWQQYRALDWPDLGARMRRPAWVFDARSVADADQVKAAGLSLWRVGDGDRRC